MGHATARRHDEGVDTARVIQLLDEFDGAFDIAQSTGRRISRSQGNDIRVETLAPVFFSNLMEPGVRARLILAFGLSVNDRAQKFVHQHIATADVTIVVERHAVFQLHMAAQTQLGGSRGGGSNIVRLDGAGDQDGIGVLRQRLAQIEFKLPNFVATKGQPCGVVPLYLKF